jgi:uncharacterized membrane protein
MIWYVLLGISTGMRTMTAMAVLCWFAWLRLVPQDGWAFWAGNLVSAIVFTLLALGEYVGDTLPFTPRRTLPPLLLGRVVFASLAGALAAHATVEPLAGGIVFGALGSLIGAFGGYRLRMFGARLIGRDLPVALGESALALGFALYAAFKLHSDLLSQTVQGIIAARFHG